MIWSTKRSLLGDQTPQFAFGLAFRVLPTFENIGQVALVFRVALIIEGKAIVLYVIKPYVKFLVKNEVSTKPERWDDLRLFIC